MNKILGDIGELQKFYDLAIPDLKPFEVFFLSLSARNKYLTEEERKDFGLGRTEMYARTILRERSFDKLVAKLRRFETNNGAYLTKKGKDIPDQANVVYWNINPSSTIKALKEFNSQVNEFQSEIIHIASQGGDFNNLSHRMNKLDQLLMNCYQRNQNKTYWIDIDFDIPKDRYDLVEKLLEDFRLNGVHYLVIDTKSGYHIMIDRQTLNYNFNESISDCNDLAEDTVEDYHNNYEIVVNKNNMIPLPGTYQAGHIVKVKETYN